MQPLKITITHHDTTVEIELPWDSDIFQVADALRRALMGIGFHPANVESIMPDTSAML